ncbi:cupin domain-containing protein [Streptomyces sp. NPDC007162]|uniref:cupin domain-containing protein n=1 Tax=Streptomyces sp. NPDC007162 TaxID=3156917 RepID=UPI003411771B
MAMVSITGPGEGELIVNGPSTIRILEDGSNTDHRLGMAEITIPAHTAGPPQHRHAQHDEGFYILSGSVRFTVGQDDYDAGAGTWVMVPPGAPHTFANVTDDTAVMLNTFTPDLYVQYFRDLKAMVESGQPLSRDAVAEVWTKYGTEPSTEYAT